MFMFSNDSLSKYGINMVRLWQLHLHVQEEKNSHTDKRINMYMLQLICIIRKCVYYLKYSGNTSITEIYYTIYDTFR